MHPCNICFIENQAFKTERSRTHSAYCADSAMLIYNAGLQIFIARLYSSPADQLKSDLKDHRSEFQCSTINYLSMKEVVDAINQYRKTTPQRNNLQF